MFLCDTNVISEITKPNPNQHIINFINDNFENLFISVMTIAEIQSGILYLKDDYKRDKLSLWLSETIIKNFARRILNINIGTAIQYADIKCAAKRTLPIIDTLIASTAINNNLTLVTRNTKDFEGIEGLSLFNPWN